MSDSKKALFSHHEHALERAFEVCPDCGSELHIKQGKKGPFIGCTNYPNCQYTRAIVEHEKVEDQVLSGSECPQCQHELAVKQGRYGLFIGCTNYPHCHYIAHESVPELDLPCPVCQQGQLQQKTNRYGKQFYACSSYPKCKFILNSEPKAGQCSGCGFKLLTVKRNSRGEQIICADKKCGKTQA